MGKNKIVTESFRDKLTGDFHPIGSEYASDDPKRIKELEKMGYLNDGDVSEEDPKDEQSK